MKYILLLRGINVGGNNKVSMKELKENLAALRFENIITYINSGNIIFSSNEELTAVDGQITTLLADYPFPIRHVLLTGADYLTEAAALPAWWDEPLARKDVLFYHQDVDFEQMKARINTFPLHDEVVYFSKRAVFWGKYTEAEYLRTAYHKFLAKENFYPLITIRNGKTFMKLKELLANE